MQGFDGQSQLPSSTHILIIDITHTHLAAIVARPDLHATHDKWIENHLQEKVAFKASIFAGKIDLIEWMKRYLGFINVAY